MNIGQLAERLVENEVCYCVSGLVSTALASGWDSEPLVESVAVRYDWESGLEAYLRALSVPDLRELCDSLLGTQPPDREQLETRILGHLKGSENGLQEFCNRVGIDCADVETEVYEHWVVTDWLADRLRERGEAVCYDWQGLTIWGRCTTGQRIAADYVIRQIAKEEFYQ